MSNRQTQNSARMTAAVRREQLLDVTTEIVIGEGFQAVSIQSVARRAGISRPLVYEHFGDLDGLLGALVERDTSQALAQVAETTPDDLTDGDPGEMMVESLRRYLNAVEHHPNTWRLVLMPPEGAPEQLREAIVSGREQVLDRLARAVGPGLKLSSDDPDPELMARILSTLADEYARLLLTDAERFPRERLLVHAEWHIRHFAASLAAPAAKPTG